MPVNPKSLLNLQKGRGKGGRKPKLSTMLKYIPEEAQAQINKALWTALTHNNIDEARAYMKSVDIPEYGFVIQIVMNELGRKNAFQCLMEIYERLFGKPRQAVEVSTTENAEKAMAEFEIIYKAQTNTSDTDSDTTDNQTTKDNGQSAD